jgi:hypothetical protein
MKSHMTVLHHAALGLSLSALTALHTLNLEGHDRSFVVYRGAMRLMRAAGNSFQTEGCAALEASLTALTALQSLNLSSKTLCFVACAFDAQGGCEDGCRHAGVFVWLMHVTENYFGPERLVALVRLLPALTALQLLELGGKLV